MDDIARAFHQAIAEQIPDNLNRKKEFSCITHSTGGPVIRTWIDKYYGAEKLNMLPLKHLIMLAPANHGSALAQLGKERIGRIKSFFEGVEPGVRILDWLELGSVQQTELNRKWFEYKKLGEVGFYPVVLTGQKIDKNFYDFLNSYLVEDGSDGVVRVAATNMNYRYVRLMETNNKIDKNIYALEVDKQVEVTPLTAFGVIPDASHSGETFGIMKSVTTQNASDKPVVLRILESLKVKNADDYKKLIISLQNLTQNTQTGKSRYMMLIFIINDASGNPVNNYDLFILAGKDYSPGQLPKGFFKDRQRNSKNINRLTYYVNADKMLQIKDEKIGFKVTARPQDGFVYYNSAEFHSESILIDKILAPNQTLIIDIVLRRHIDKEVFRLDSAQEPWKSFKDIEPCKENIET